MTDMPANVDADMTADITVDSVQERRERRLLDGLANAGRSTRSAIDGQRTLFLLGNLMAAFGFLIIMIAWKGAADTGFVFEQIPFLISGGLGGLGLMIFGGFLYTGWWLTRSIRQQRTQHTELLAQQQALTEAVAGLAEIVTKQTEIAAETRLAVEAMSKPTARTTTRKKATRKKSTTP